MVQVNSATVKTAGGGVNIADASTACASGENRNSLALTSL